jgi:protein SCO1/2
MTFREGYRLRLRMLAGALLIVPTVGAIAQGNLQDIIQKTTVEQKLNAPLPLDTVFRDEEGKTVTLGSYFGKKPVILALVYYRCPMLCNRILYGLLTALKAVKFDAGKDFEVVAISIDPRETPELALGKKKAHVRAYGREGAESGWHFLVGDQESIRRVADATGFHYVYLPEKDQYSHPAVIMIATPQGVLSRYFFGVEYSSRDIQLGLMDASEGKIGNLVDAVILYCFAYDPSVGKYSLMIIRLLQVLGTLTALILGLSIYFLLRWERHKRALSGSTHGHGVSIK